MAKAPERLIETRPSGSARPDAVQGQTPHVLSARFVLSDAGSSACFSPSHAFTDPPFLAAFLFHIVASDTDTGLVMCLQITCVSPVIWGKGFQLGAFG